MRRLRKLNNLTDGLQLDRQAGESGISSRFSAVEWQTLAHAGHVKHVCVLPAFDSPRPRFEKSSEQILSPLTTLP